MATIRAYEREFFLQRVFKYGNGEHLSIVGPTNSGKTFLAQQLLSVTASPRRPVVNLVMKPKDKTSTDFGKTNRLRTVRDWDWKAIQAAEFWRPEKPNGWMVWPKHKFDPDIDDPAHYKIFRDAILDSYKRGKRIIFADEVYSLCKELDLTRELITVWTKGRSMDTAVWAATQRPRDVPLHMYSAAEHLFLANDPDSRMRERFGEIGGIDGKLVTSAVAQLPRHWWLYIRRADRTMCVVRK